MNLRCKYLGHAYIIHETKMNVKGVEKKVPTALYCPRCGDNHEIEQAVYTDTPVKFEAPRPPQITINPIATQAEASEAKWLEGASESQKEVYEQTKNI